MTVYLFEEFGTLHGVTPDGRHSRDLDGSRGTPVDRHDPRLVDALIALHARPPRDSVERVRATSSTESFFSTVWTDDMEAPIRKASRRR